MLTMPGKRGLRGALALGTLAGLLLVPASAQSTVTIGSNLANDPDTTFNCGAVGPCTYAQNTLPPLNAATDGVRSPVNGTVIRWGIRTRSFAQTPLAFRVIRPSGSGYTGAGTTDVGTPPSATTKFYDAAVPIQIGDLIGIDGCGGIEAGPYFRSGSSPDATYEWNPALADGGAALAPTAPNNAYELTINAEIEPTNAYTVDQVKGLKGGKA